jgi:hypothetical protein
MSFETINTVFVSFLRKLYSEDEIEEVLERWEEENEELKNIIKKQEKKAKKTSKKKKPADAPKAARSPYIFFCMEEREKIKEENPKIENKEIMREMGRRWAVLKEEDEEEFNRFQEMAAEDKKRFADEKKEYVPTEADEKPKKKVSKRTKSAYMFFCDDMRPQLKEEGFSGKELMTELGSRWKELKDNEDRADEYAEYLEKAAEAKNEKVDESDDEEEVEEKPKKKAKKAPAKKVPTKKVPAKKAPTKKVVKKMVSKKVESDSEESDTESESESEDEN